MKVEIFSVFDSKAKAFMQPFYATAPGLAQRMFRDLVNGGQGAVSQYPEDFTLFHIGTFDDATGQVVALAQHVNLGLASMYKGVGHASDAS